MKLTQDRWPLRWWRCLVLALALLRLLAVAPLAFAQAACDPTRQSCAPGNPSSSSPASPVQSCGPSPGGSTCGGAGPASMGNLSGTPQGAGNPIHLVNANKYQMEVDMPALPGVLGLELVRHYNSRYSLPNTPTGRLGRSWKLSYETQLYDTRAGLQIVQADGTRLIFQPAGGDASHCTSADPAHGSVSVREPPSGKLYLWRWPDGRELQFGPQGQLESITAPTGERVTLRYDLDARLLSVTDPQGRTLRLQLVDHEQARERWTRQGLDTFLGVGSIHSPVGTFTYHYTAPLSKDSPREKLFALGNLTGVDIPTGEGQPPIQRRYHYESERFPTLLTGISVQGRGSDGQPISQRIATYAYDAGGRAILSEGPRDKIRLDISTPGRTVLTDGQGQQTTYSHANIAGQWRLMQSRGAGCASCSPANMRYGYDALARLTEQTALDATGRPTVGTRSTLDARGRTLRLERVSYQGGNGGGKGADTRGGGQSVELLARYEYAGDNPQPVLIARPSVVAGREYQLRVRYNAQGQPLEVEESGFAPIFGQADQGAPITRRTTYTYETIQQRSVLVRIDGPLANGPSGTPQDSDVTLLQWDAQARFITQRTEPGNVVVRFARDAAGRIVQSTMEDGFRKIQTDIGYSTVAALAVEPESVVKTAWLLINAQPDAASQARYEVLQARFDAFGRRTTHSSGGQPASSLQYDDQGRPAMLTNALGHRTNWIYAPNSSLLAQFTQTRDGQMLDGRAWLRSEDGRLRAQLSPQGVDHIYAYRDEGEQALWQQERLRRRAISTRSPLRATAAVMAPYASAPRADGVTAIRDDFGRIVHERLYAVESHRKWPG